MRIFSVREISEKKLQYLFPFPINPGLVSGAGQPSALDLLWLEQWKLQPARPSYCFPVQKIFDIYFTKSLQLQSYFNIKKERLKNGIVGPWTSKFWENLVKVWHLVKRLCWIRNSVSSGHNYISQIRTF